MLHRSNVRYDVNLLQLCSRVDKTEKEGIYESVSDESRNHKYMQGKK